MMARTWQLILVLFIPLLAGCAQTWQPAHVQLPFVWRGEMAKVFFAKYGQPYETRRRRTGRKFYRWRAPPNPEAIRLANEAYLHAEDRPIYECEMFLEADESGRIVEFQIVRDGIGIWGTSSCNEIFSGNPLEETTAIL